MRKRFEALRDDEHEAMQKSFDEKIRIYHGAQTLSQEEPFAFLFDTDYAIYTMKPVLTGGPVMEETFSREMEALLRGLVEEDAWLYAMEWEHSTFRMWPHSAPPEAAYEEIPYAVSLGVAGLENYRAYYPTFVPGKHFHFFVQPDFAWGYLHHPWEGQAWIWGREMIEAFDVIYGHWKVLDRKCPPARSVISILFK